MVHFGMVTYSVSAFCSAHLESSSAQIDSLTLNHESFFFFFYLYYCIFTVFYVGYSPYFVQVVSNKLVLGLQVQHTIRQQQQEQREHHLCKNVPLVSAINQCPGRRPSNNTSKCCYLLLRYIEFSKQMLLDACQLSVCRPRDVSIDFLPLGIWPGKLPMLH